MTVKTISIPNGHNLAGNLAKNPSGKRNSLGINLDEIHGKNPGKTFGYREFLSSATLIFTAGILARFMAGTIHCNQIVTKDK